MVIPGKKKMPVLKPALESCKTLKINRSSRWTGALPLLMQMQVVKMGQDQCYTPCIRQTVLKACKKFKESPQRKDAKCSPQQTPASDEKRPPA